MNAASLAAAAATVWPTADAERKGLILNELFRQAWADMALEFEPQIATLPMSRDLFPGGVTIEQMFDDDDPDLETDVVNYRIDKLTLVDLRLAMTIERGNILREHRHLKALACLLASKILDGAAEDELVMPEAPQ